jgi:hypothetical protein
MRKCKLLGDALPPYRTWPYKDCPRCEERILQIASHLHRPAVYSDFLTLRPRQKGAGFWENMTRQVGSAKLRWMRETDGR